MTKSDTRSRRRLFRLLDRIIGEERTFKRHSRDIVAQGRLTRQSRSVSTEPALADHLERFRKAHEEICKLHSKFINEHELVIQRCLTISRQTRAGLLNENEMALEVERLQQELVRIKREHGQVEKECQRAFGNKTKYLVDSEPKT